MSRSKKKKDPIRTLVRAVAFLAVAAAVCAAVFFGLRAFEQNSLAQKIKDTQASNQKKQEQYQTALAEYESATQKGQNLSWPLPNAEGWDVVDLSTFALENTRFETKSRAELVVGGMMLVNQWHPLPADFSESGLVSVGKTTSWRVGASSTDVKLFPQAVEALDKALIDAGISGLKDYNVSEGYRTNDKQTELFNNKMNKLADEYSGDTLVEMTKKQVNYPGTSEYQSGFSFLMALYSKTDPNVVKQNFQESEQGKWFTENCWKYGFVFRFPTKDFPNASWIDKSYKTGVTIKLSLYRWVGEAHAAIMHIKDFCMEEYLEYLVEHPHLAVYENGTLKYEIFRQAVGEEAEVQIQVPLAATSYQASLDNMGGIVTAFLYQ